MNFRCDKSLSFGQVSQVKEYNEYNLFTFTAEDFVANRGNTRSIFAVYLDDFHITKTDESRRSLPKFN